MQHQLEEEEEEDEAESGEEEVERSWSSSKLSKMHLLVGLMFFAQGMWYLGSSMECHEGSSSGESLLVFPSYGPQAPLHSSILEYPSGELQPHLADGKDALLLLYAPWESNDEAFHILSRLRSIFPSQEDLSLGAINCWNQNGPCYKRYFAEGLSPSQRQLHYPQWIYLPKNRSLKDPFSKAIFFNADTEDTTYTHILSFILRQRYPVRVWRNHEEWLIDRARFGGLSLTGYFESHEQLREYVRAAEMMASMDPKDAILPMGVVLNKELAKRIGVKLVKLFWWNGSMELPKKASINRTLILTWTKKSLTDRADGLKHLVSEIQTSSRKSFLLDNLLNGGSRISLLAFLWPDVGGRNPHQGLSIMRESALLYFTTKDDFELNKNGVKDLYESFVQLRKDTEKQLFIDEAECKNVFPGDLSEVNPCSHSMYYNVSSELNTKGNPPLFGDEASIRRSIISKKRSLCLHLAHKELDSGCFSQQQRQHGDFMDEKMKEELLGIHPGNKSLNFFFVNAKSNQHLMRVMGLDLRRSNQVLIDNLKEGRRWKMNSNFESKSLSQFIWDFHYAQNSMKEFLRSKEFLETCGSTSELCLPEVSASGLLDLLSNSLNTHVVVLYQTKSCYFCAAARKSMHELKRFLEPVQLGVGRRLSFVTIDGAYNDLPMEHTAPVFPSLVFYSAEDKSKSGVYPLGENFDSESLKQFLLGKMTPDEVLRVEAHWCNEACFRSKEFQLRHALLQTPDSVQRKFFPEFEEIKGLLWRLVNDIQPSSAVNPSIKYEFIRDFRTLLNDLL